VGLRETLPLLKVNNFESKKMGKFFKPSSVQRVKESSSNIGKCHLAAITEVLVGNSAEGCLEKPYTRERLFALINRIKNREGAMEYS
jgi:hypothetical protein